VQDAAHVHAGIPDVVLSFLADFLFWTRNSLSQLQPAPLQPRAGVLFWASLCLYQGIQVLPPLPSIVALNYFLFCFYFIPLCQSSAFEDVFAALQEPRQLPPKPFAA
jgi:fatty acid desaturase